MSSISTSAPLLYFSLVNPCIALLFLRTRVALGRNKSPTSLSRKTTNLFVSNCTMEFSTMASSKKVIARTTDNRKQQYGRKNRKYFISARHGQKNQNCRCYFDAIYHSPRDMSISGLGGHIAISGCRSLLLSFGGHFLSRRSCRKVRFCYLNYNNTYSGSVLSYQST